MGLPGTGLVGNNKIQMAHAHTFPRQRKRERIYAPTPTNPAANLELQNPPRDVSELRKVRRSSDLEALKL